MSNRPQRLQEATGGPGAGESGGSTAGGESGPSTTGDDASLPVENAIFSAYHSGKYELGNFAVVTYMYMCTCSVMACIQPIVGLLYSNVYTRASIKLCCLNIYMYMCNFNYDWIMKQRKCRKLAL